MRSPSPAFTLLSMFTTTERAAEIEGDLIEQSHAYGKSWMRRHVALVALSLFGRAISRNGSTIALLSAASLAAVFSSVLLSEQIFRGPVGHYVLEQLELSLTAAKLTVLGCTVVPATYLIGTVLVRASPALGPKVAAATAMVFTLFVTAMHLYVDRPAMVLVKVALEFGLVTVPLLGGCVLSHRRSLRRLLNRVSQT